MSSGFFSFFSNSQYADKDIGQFAAALQLMPSALCLVEEAGNIIFANERMAKLFDLSVTDIKNKPIADFGLTQQDIDSLLQSNTSTKVLKELVTKDADPVYMSVGATKLPNQPYILLGFDKIEEYHHFVQEQKCYKSIIDSYPFAIAAEDKRGICRIWNKQAQDLFNLPASQVLGKKLRELLPSELTGALAILSKEVENKQQACLNRQMSFKNAAGSEVILSVSHVRVPGAGKALSLTIFEDITARGKQEIELLQNRNLLQAILDNIPLGIYTRSIDGDMTYYNKQSQVILSVAEPKYVNSPHPKQDLETVQGYITREQQIIREGKRKEFPDEIYVGTDGTEKIIHIIKVPLTQAGPKPLVLTIVEDVTKRREQEHEIQMTNGFLSAILDNAPIGLYARTRTGQMLFSNKMSEEIFHDEETKNEKGFSSQETPEQIEGYLNREAEILEKGQPLEVPEEPYVTQDGINRLLHMIKVPVQDANGKAGFVITMVEDITERKKQEKNLEAAHRLQQLMLENAPLAIYAFDPEHNLLFANKKTKDMLVVENPHSPEEKHYIAREQEIFKSHQITDIAEESYTTASGREILLHLIKVPVFDKDDKPLMMLTIAEDVTHQKQQEKELNRANNFLQNVVDNLPVALSVRKADGTYIVWNKHSEELFGVSAKQVIGEKNYRTDITKEQADFMLEADQRVFQSGKELNIAQELISTPNEGVKIMHTVKTPLYTPEGEADYLLNVSEDITAKTKMEKQIRETGEKTSLLLENVQESILILEDNKIIYSNKAAWKLFGVQAEEELSGKDLFSFIAPDYQLAAKEHCESVMSRLSEGQAPVQLRLAEPANTEIEMRTLLSKYLGRRILIAFITDITKSNKTLREIRSEREKFKSIFKYAPFPAFILNAKGYISTMNKEAQTLFHFTEQDRNFYRNVYVRPGLPLSVRRQLDKGAAAEMDYVFDFQRAAEKFPQRIHGTGTLPLHFTFTPFNIKNTEQGRVQADYLVTLRLAAPKPNASVSRQEPAILPPAPAVNVYLPNTEPYVLCSDSFRILSVNQLFCNLCQLSKEELQGQPLLKLFHPDSIQLLANDLKILTQKGSLENQDYQLCIASSLETASVRMNATSTPDGHYVFLFRNMSYQQQIMKVLQERSSQLNALLEATDGIVFSVSFDDNELGHILQANKYVSQSLGYTHDELLGLPFKKLFAQPDEKNTASLQKLLTEAAHELNHKGHTSFTLPLFTKNNIKREVVAHLSLMANPGQNAVLAVVTDLSEIFKRLSHTSQEALELHSMRRSLPGLYLKTNWDGCVLEVSSNLPYLTQEEAKNIFLGKKPSEYWPWDTVEKELFSIKEASSVNVNTTFDFEWELRGQQHAFEALCTPIDGREEVVIWIKDVTDKKTHERNIRKLYALSNEKKGDLTSQVDRILAFGKDVFKADIGIVMKFTGHSTRKMTVVYATAGDFNIERYMMFPVEECMQDVCDDNVVAFSDLANTNCTHCIHKEKGFGSLIAAPLYVGGKVAGALCFAARKPRIRFPEGAEELIGIMSRVLSLRIELREASKTLSETSESFIRTLDYIELPAVVLDLQYRIRYANNIFLSVTGHVRSKTEQREFFQEFIRKADASRRMFENTEQSASGNAFQVTMDLIDERGKYIPTGWDVFVMKDIKGEVEGYGLIGVKQNQR